MLRNASALLIQQINKLGFQLEENKGICASISPLSIQAFLSGDLETFYFRISFLFTETHLAQFINHIKTRHKEAKNNPEAALSEEEKLIEEFGLELIAFCERIEIYLNPEKHSDLFDKVLHQQSIIEIANLTASKEIEHLGGMLAIKNWRNIYSKDELLWYVAALDQAVKSHSEDFAFCLRNNYHRLSLCYSKQTQTWFIIDTYQLPKEPDVFNDVFSLTLALYKSLGEIEIETENTPLAFSTSIFTTKSREYITKNMVQTLESLPNFIKAHKLTKEKLLYRTKTNVSLAYIAARDGDATLINKIGTKLAEFNLPQDYLSTAISNGWTPSHIAAQNGHANVIHALAQFNTNQSKENNDKQTPAYIAAKYECPSVIEALGQAKQNLDCSPSKDNIPLHLAAYYNCEENIRALIAGGANVNRLNNHGSNALHIATRNESVAAVKALATAGINLNQANKLGYTAANIAASKGNVAILRILHEHNADLTSQSGCEETPLQSATKNNQQDAIHFLLNHATKPAVMRTPMHTYSPRMFTPQETHARSSPRPGSPSLVA